MTTAALAPAARPAPVADARGPRSRGALAVLAMLALLGVVALTALGVWQVERRAWKLDLIARVEQRLQAPPVAAPGPDRWAVPDEYRRVRLTGRFLPTAETRVQAVTDIGGGFWVLAPFRSDEGFTVLVNRGFGPADARAMPPPAGPVTITGLLRPSEPGGAFLRTNDPAGGRWFSRDVDAIAAAHGLGMVAPYFVDADAARIHEAGQPVGGLTVVRFNNNHLVYAVTWFALDLMLIGGGVLVARREWRLRRVPG